MTRPTALFVLLAFFCCASAAGAAENAVPLALKFSAGDTLQYDVSFSGGGGATAPGEDIAVVAIQGSLSVVQNVVEVLPDGSGRLETTIPRIQANISVGEDKVSFTLADGKLRWFANGKESAPPDDAAVKNIPLIGSPVVITVAPNGRTTGVSFADPQLMGQLSQAVPGLDLGRLWENSQAVFPDAPVSVGETWRNTMQYSPLGVQMPVTVTISRTLDEYTEQAGVGLARISSFTDGRVATQGELPTPAGVAVSIPEMRQTVTATEFFNTTKGQLVRGDYDVSFRTSFGIKLGEEEKSGRVEARLRVSVQAR